MRKALAVMVAVLIGVVGAPLLAAGSSAATGSVEGRVVDATGRAVTGQRIELVRDSLVVSTSVTATTGHWMFRDVAAGDYVVRLNLRGTIAGIRVTVTPGASLNGRLIVTPASAAAPQIGAVAGFLASGASSAVVTAAAAAASVATSTVTETKTVAADATSINKVLDSLTPEQKKVFAEELKKAVANEPTGGNTFATDADKEVLITALNQIIANPNEKVTLPGNQSGNG
jgi:hypothetical protein